MRGNVFGSSGNDAFDWLGYLADLGTGTLYLVAKSLETNGADVSHAGGDYGTRCPRHGGCVESAGGTACV